MRNSLLLIIIVFLGVSCSSKKEQNPDLANLIKKSRLTVLMFFAPDCPLCINYSKPLIEIGENYDEVQYIAVQSGKHYDAMEIQMYASEFGVKNIFRDYDYMAAHKYDAGITPEFVLVDSSGKVLYQGLLDNRMDQLGVYKQKWDKHYLIDAIEATLSGKEIKITKTEAIGCDLEY